ncbi:MAG TPA: ComEC/Rec2 family competence protein, partial [Rudaea sp.]
MAIALLAGAVAVQTLPRLPPTLVIAALAIAGWLMLFVHSRWRLAGFVLIGIAWTCWRADAALAQRLPAGYEGDEVSVVGRVHGLPHRDGDDIHFEMRIEAADRDGAPAPLTGLVRASWYRAAAAPAPCERWHLRLRVKRPRGLVDPGAFDFERYALSEGINATGYVRDDTDNRALGASAFCIDALRLRIVEGISTALGDGTSAHLLR